MTTSGRMDPVLVALGALVVASLSANGVLFARWRAKPAAAPAQVAAPPRRPPAFTSAWRQPFPGLSRAGAESAPVTLEACVQGTTRLESQLVELDRLGVEHTPPVQRFQKAPPNAELTTAFKEALDRHIPMSAGGPITAECRSGLCRLVVPLANRNDPRLAAFRESQFAGENLKELESDDEGLLFEKKEHPDMVSGSDILQNALQDFESSEAIDACQKKFKGEGTLDLQLSIVPAEGAKPDEQAGLSLRADGRLAGTPLGGCIQTAFERALGAITLPAHYDRASVSAQYPKP